MLLVGGRQADLSVELAVGAGRACVGAEVEFVEL